MNRQWFAAASCLVIGLGVSGTALADPQSQGAQANATAQAASTQDSAPSAGEVVVTAQKRSERLSKIPSAVSAVTSAQLVSANAVEQRDLVGLVPSLQVAGGLGSGALAIRGLPTVGTQIDGAPIGSVAFGAAATSFLPLIDPSTISRIEVLRGPQGTLYGGSTLSGIVNYVTSAPNLERVGASAYVEGSDTIGGGQNWTGRLMFTAPIVPDKLAFQVSGFSDNFSGFVDATTLNRKDYNTGRDFGGRVALLWQPTPDFSVQLSDLYSSERAYEDEVVGDPITAKPVGPDLTYAPPILPSYDHDFNITLLKAHYNFSWASLDYVGSYQTDNSIYTINDTGGLLGNVLSTLPAFGGQPIPNGSAIGVRSGEPATKTTQEFRLTSPDTGSVQWVAGFFYNHESANDTDAVGVVDRNQAMAAGPLGRLLVFNLITNLTEISGFGDVTVSLTPKLDVTGGLRYGDVSQYFEQRFSGGDTAAYNTLFGLFGFSPVPADTGQNRTDQSFSTYLANVRYRFTPDTMAYFRFSTGFRPGGPNVAAIGLPHTFNADSTVNYEIGLKTDFWEKRGYLELTAYSIEWNNIQATALSPGGTAGNINGGHAHSRGVEASVNLRPIEGLAINGMATYTDARYDQNIITSDGIIALKGDDLGSPQFSATIGAEYEWPLNNDWRAFVNGQIRYNGSREAAPQHTTLVVPYLIPAYTIADIGAGIRHDNLELAIFARNVGNERAQLGVFNFGPSYLSYVVLQRPETIGASLKWRY